MVRLFAKRDKFDEPFSHVEVDNLCCNYWDFPGFMSAMLQHERRRPAGKGACQPALAEVVRKKLDPEIRRCSLVGQPRTSVPRAYRWSTVGSML
jgi:hypothetical protein